MISQEHETSIIQHGLTFMRSITEAYGPEEGMKLWDTIANTLGDNIKGKIFFAMVSGQYTSQIIIRNYTNYSNKIDIIKCIRTHDNRRLGLKEAKDLVDNLYMGNSIKLEVDPTLRHRAVDDLIRIGCVI